MKIVEKSIFKNVMMTKLELITENYPDIEFLSADGFEEAIIGICDEKLVYSISQCIDILMNDNDMSIEDALDYFYFNVEGAYVGEKTPIWVNDMVFNE